MKMIWKALALMILTTGCHNVVRDESVYKLEVGFMEQASVQQSDSLANLVKTYCKCTVNSAGVKAFTTSECEAAAKKSVLAKSRVPWHASMMLYNARLLDTRPSVDPPAVPSATTLCP